MTKVIHGKVRGRTIECTDDLGLADGQEVEVQVRTLSSASITPGEGLRRTEGALTDDTEWDAIMDEIYQARKVERRAAAPDLGQP